MCNFQPFSAANLALLQIKSRPGVPESAALPLRTQERRVTTLTGPLCSPTRHSRYAWVSVKWKWKWSRVGVSFNPFIPKSDQYQISPAASPQILHHTVGRTWLFIACSDARWLYYQLSLTSVTQFSLQGWENAVFELGSGRVKSAKNLLLLPDMEIEKSLLACASCHYWLSGHHASGVLAAALPRTQEGQWLMSPNFTRFQIRCSHSVLSLLPCQTWNSFFMGKNTRRGLSLA